MLDSPCEELVWIPRESLTSSRNPVNGLCIFTALPWIAERAEGDALMIDVESIIAAEEIRKQAAAVEQIRDAGTKWLSKYPDEQRNSIEQLAVNFLLTMNSTLCFFTVAMRMLSTAPWADTMISLDVRQSAIVAISRRWFVKSEGFCKYPFTRAELALREHIKVC